jgi:mannose-6-phosphate isomerase-like protein (cupin superfamily)
MPTTATPGTDAAQAVWFYGDLVLVHLSGRETEGRLCLLEFLQPEGEMTPLHVHRGADQAMYVLEGEITLYLPGRAVTAGPGACAYGPRGVPHTERVGPAGVRLMEVCSPAGFEDFVIAAGVPATTLTLPPADLPPDLERIAALAAEHDIQVLGPPGELP